MVLKFYKILKRLRCERGLSQQALGEAVFINQSVISNWETNIKQPNLKNLIRLADFFNVTIDQLAGRASLPESNNQSNNTSLQLPESDNQTQTSSAHTDNSNET